MVEPPQNAVGPDVTRTGSGEDVTYEVSWAHFVEGNVIVDGDALVVRINAATGRPYTLFRKWRKAPPEQEPAAASR